VMQRDRSPSSEERREKNAFYSRRHRNPRYWGVVSSYFSSIMSRQRVRALVCRA